MSYADYLRLNPQDQVAIACRDLEPGTPLENSTCQDLIPAGHKVALARKSPRVNPFGVTGR